MLSAHMALLKYILITVAIVMSSSYMNNSLSTSSDIEVRYHKAVKQISKLININTGLKKQCDYFKNVAQQLENQLMQMKQEKQHMIKEINFLKQQSNGLFYDKNQLINEINQMKSQLDIRGKSSSSQIQKAGKIRAYEQQFDLFKMQVENLQDKLQHQGSQLIYLQEKLGTRNQENKQLSLNLQQLQNENKSLQLQIKQAENQVYPTSCINCKNMKQQLISVKQWSSRIDQQNVNLKKKFILHGQEYAFPYSTKIPASSKTGFQFSIMEALEQRNRELNMAKKEENLKIRKALGLKQQQNRMLKIEVHRLKERVKQLEGFFKKQRVYLEETAKYLQGQQSHEVQQRN